MPNAASAAARLALLNAISAIPEIGRLDPTPLEAPIRAYAKAQREAGIGIVPLLTDVKKMIRERTGRHEIVLTPRVVGWAVAGFYDGTSSKGGS
jgi:hypothetical protein